MIAFGVSAAGQRGLLKFIIVAGKEKHSFRHYLIFPERLLWTTYFPECIIALLQKAGRRLTACL
jgi:hypothetical protein